MSRRKRDALVWATDICIALLLVVTAASYAWLLR